MIAEDLRGPFYGRTLAEIQADIADRGVRAVAEETLDAIERINPTLNAFVYVDRDDVLAHVEKLEARADHGPLHGIPVAVKDLVDVAGYPITIGSNVLATRRAERDAEAIRRLRTAGALIVGITLTHEFAFGPTGDVSAYGAAHNPHDLRRMTGGSSAGSGAAVAAGLVPLALGTDTGGSIRVPAALCGVVGFKGSHGDVPTDGVYPLSPTLDHLGPLGSSVEMVAAAYEVLSARALVASAQHVVPAYLRQDIAQVPFQDSRVSALIEKLVAPLTDGADSFGLGDWSAMRADAATIMTREAYLVHENLLDERRSDYQLEVWERIDSGRGIADGDYRAALDVREAMIADLLARLPDNAVLLSPTVSITAPMIGERDTDVDGETGPTRAIVTNLTTRWNLMGFPAMAVPCGAIDGLPVSVQLVSKPGSEPALLAAAARCEQLAATP